MANSADEITSLFEKLIGDIRRVLDFAEDKLFQGWFDRLRKSTPAIDKDTVTFTRDNFRLAMRQAFRAGLMAAEAKKKTEDAKKNKA